MCIYCLVWLYLCGYFLWITAKLTLLVCKTQKKIVRNIKMIIHKSDGQYKAIVIIFLFFFI